MDKKDILELFLKNGILLTPDEFGAIDEKNYMQVLKKRSGEKNEDEISVAIPRAGKLSCDQFIRICSDKFEFLKDEILRKTEAVSINKGKRVFSEITIIGRVKEMVSGGFVIEDVTGEAEVASESRDISAGDVIGLKGFFKENRFFPAQVIWPDIPLGNVPALAGSRITLTTSVTEGMPGLIICPEAQKADNVITGFGRLGFIKISRHGSKFVIMAYAPPDEVSEDAAVRMLKKRMVPDERVVENLIAEVPGIMWLFNNKRSWTRNYRGVFIVSTDAESIAEYDGTEVIFGKAARNDGH